MPSKFGRVFQKRRSSGDVLDEVKNPPSSSFRVLERPQPVEGSKSFDDRPPRGLRRPNDFRPQSEGNVDEASLAPGVNRGSRGTHNSGSSDAYNASSSDRYSSTSTLPSSSSFENAQDFGHPHAHPRSSKTMPTAYGHDREPGFLKTAGRKFSFGEKSQHLAEELPAQQTNRELGLPVYGRANNSTMDRELPAIPPVGRTRATTENSSASESTITAGVAGLSKLDFRPDDDDGFGDIFSGIGEDRSRSKAPTPAASNSDLGRPLTESKSYKAYRPGSTMPAPLKPTLPYNSLSSPPIPSATSADGLIVASPLEEKSGLFGALKGTARTGTQGPTSTATDPQSPTSPTDPNRPQRQRRQSRRDSKTILPRRESENWEDTDALLVSESANRKTGSPMAERQSPVGVRKDGGTGFPKPPMDLRPSVTTANPWAEEKPPPPPAHGKAPEHNIVQSPDDTGIDHGLLNDVSFQALAISADHLQQRAPSPPRVKPAGKVMTPAQFERYRREQAQRRSTAEESGSNSEGSDNEVEEEEDELDRNKRLAQQRQRQEAQLSVYRQSMMKITGEQSLGPTSSSLRPVIDRNSSRLSSKLSIGSLRDKSGIPSPADDEEEDDDVPLGILAAHGFPSKEHNRPPNHERSGSAAGIQYSSETYPPPAQSVAAGPTGNLPAFARKLPQDPFYGSSIVNQPDRQSFALGGGSPGSVYGGSQAAGSASSSNLPPPGGLIGVIASEERARAIRRGSPAKTFGLGSQDPNGSMPLPPGMGGQPTMAQAPAMPAMVPPPMNPEQQANMQMAQQMTQMMQMQMQWMQQMMTMQAQGMQMTPQMQQMQQMMMGMQMPGLPSMPGSTPGMMPGQQPSQAQQSGRASTMMHPPNMHLNLAAPNQGSRTMSMMAGSNRASSVMLGGVNGMGAGPGPGYTPSIAPSERSNIGQPSRYRPVSTVPANGETRSRTQSMSSKSNLGGFDSIGRTSTMGASRPMTSGGLQSKSTLNVRLVETRPNHDDDEDEAGWEEMRKKKENKKSLWRLKKGSSSSPAMREKENVSPRPPPHRATTSPAKDVSLADMFVPDPDRI